MPIYIYLYRYINIYICAQLTNFQRTQNYHLKPSDTSFLLNSSNTSSYIHRFNTTYKAS